MQSLYSRLLSWTLIFGALAYSNILFSYAKEYDLGLQSSSRILETVGTYRGEVRLQSSNGLIDRPLQSNIQLTITLRPDAIQVKSSADLMGNKCQSRIQEIRELKKFGNDQSQVLTADFNFVPGKCKEYSKIDNLTLILWKNERNEVILETLLNHYLDKSNPLLKQKFFLHGYFTKELPHDKQKIETPQVAKIRS